MIRDYAWFSEENFNSELAQVDWESIFTRTQGNIDTAFSKIYNKLNKLINKHAPLKPLSKRKFKQLSKPWITKGSYSNLLRLRMRYLLQDMSANINSIERKLQPL